MVGKALLVVTLLTLVGCGSDDDDSTTPTRAEQTVVDEHDTPRGEDISFVDTTHSDGTRYRCLYIYVDGFKAGGPAIWCERLPESVSESSDR